MSLFNYIETVSSLNKKEVMEALYWMVLGDGYIGNWNRPYKCFLNIQHKETQRDYLVWKAAILSRANIGWSIGGPTSRGMVYLNSKTHPLFSKIADRLYKPLKRKALDTHALALLGPIGLAILYQDDGNYNPKKSMVRITMTSLSSVEIEAFARTVVVKFGLIFRLQRHGKGFDVGLRWKDKDKFFSLIEPYVVPTMQYKLGRGGTS